MPLYNLIRYSKDTVTVEAESKEEARRTVSLWDSSGPLDPDLRDDYPGVEWVEHQYHVEDAPFAQ